MGQSVMHSWQARSTANMIRWAYQKEKWDGHADFGYKALYPDHTA